MAQKMLFCFTNISAEILLHILSFSFCTERHPLAQFCQMWLRLNTSKIICAKAALLWYRKCWWNWPLINVNFDVLVQRAPGYCGQVWHKLAYQVMLIVKHVEVLIRLAFSTDKPLAVIVTRLGDFLPVGLLLKAHGDFLKKWSNPKVTTLWVTFCISIFFTF